MKLQNKQNEEFLARQKITREGRLGKMAELLCRFVTDSFAEDQIMLKEELRKNLELLKDGIREHMDAIQDCNELRQYLTSCGLENHVNEKILELSVAFEEKKALCAEMIHSLIPEIYVDYHPVQGEPEKGNIRLQKLAEEELPCRKELDDIQEKLAQTEEDIRRTEKERQETEAGFQDLMRQNAAERAKLEEEKPEIHYSTREIRREGFFGFLKDLFGKVQTGTIADDSELRQWQERVDRVQEGYDAQAREWNSRLEQVKERQKELETECGCLRAGLRETEEKIRTVLQEKAMQELEQYLFGEGGLSERMNAALELHMAENAQQDRKLAEKACREWMLG